MHRFPLVLCGPLVRRTAPDHVCVWVATQKPCTVELTVFEDAEGRAGPIRLQGRRDTIQLAANLHVAAVSATLGHGEAPLEWGAGYLYDLAFALENSWRKLHDDGVLRHGIAEA